MCWKRASRAGWWRRNRAEFAPRGASGTGDFFLIMRQSPKQAMAGRPAAGDKLGSGNSRRPPSSSGHFSAAKYRDRRCFPCESRRAAAPAAGGAPRRPPRNVPLTLFRRAKTCPKIRLHTGDMPAKTFLWEIFYDILAVRIPSVSGPPGDMRSVQEEIALCKQVYLMKVRDWSLCTEARRHSPLYLSAMDCSELLILK